MNVSAANGQRSVDRAAYRPRPELAATRRLAWLYCGPVRLALELTLPDPSRRCAGWAILPRAGGAAPSRNLRHALRQAGPSSPKPKAKSERLAQRS